MLRNHFEDQLRTNAVITPEMERKITYKRVWSGKLISVGDQVLYAYAVVDNKEPRLFSLLDTELDEFDKTFAFIEMRDETIPVLRYK
jgi:hypothetical protein